MAWRQAVWDSKFHLPVFIYKHSPPRQTHCWSILLHSCLLKDRCQSYSLFTLCLKRYQSKFLFCVAWSVGYIKVYHCSVVDTRRMGAYKYLGCDRMLVHGDSWWISAVYHIKHTALSPLYQSITLCWIFTKSLTIFHNQPATGEFKISDDQFVTHLLWLKNPRWPINKMFCSLIFYKFYQSVKQYFTCFCKKVFGTT